MARLFKSTCVALLVSASAVATAHAGGFSRGTADTEILYEDGNFNMRAGATIVAPNRKYSAVPTNPALVGTSPLDTYVIPSAAIKANITDDLRCAGTVTTPYGGGATWDGNYGLSAKRYERFTTAELAATCAYKFDMGKGRAWFLGGVFFENFNYDIGVVGGAVRTKLNANDVGYRLGAAYEIPEYALRIQGLYRSATEYNASGTTTRLAATGTLLDALPLGVAMPVATGHGNLPQSFELKAQSGVAPGWLVFGGVKWTDWSVLTTLDLNIINGVTPTSHNDYFYRDGWTVTGGVGHAFTDEISGALSLTWDRGVSTGWDTASDTWTVAAGTSMKDKFGGELRLGAGVSYLTGYTETKNTFNNAVDAGWALAFSGSYKIKW